MLAGIISSPQRLHPRGQPREPRSSAATWCSQNMGEQGYITPEEYAEYAETPLPAANESSRRPRTRAPRTSPPGCASSSSTATAPARPSAAASSPLDARPRAPGAVEEIASTARARRRPDRLRGRARQRDRRRPGDGRRRRLRRSTPFNLATNGQRQPGSSFKPFTLVTGARAGPLARRGLHLGPEEIPFEVKAPRRTATETLPDPSRSTTTTTPTSARLPRDRAPPTPTTRSTPQLGTQVGVENIAATARRWDQTDLATQLRVLDQRLRSRQPGDDPRRAREGVTPLEMTHAYNTLADDGHRVSRHMAASPGGPVGDRRRHRRRRLDDGDPVETDDGGDGDNESTTEQVISPERRRARPGRCLERGHLGHRHARPERRPDLGQDGTTETTATPGSAAPPTEITACVWVGHADTRHADGDRVRRRSRSTAAPSRPLIFARRRARLTRSSLHDRRGRGRDDRGQRRGRRRDRRRRRPSRPSRSRRRRPRSRRRPAPRPPAEEAAPAPETEPADAARRSGAAGGAPAPDRRAAPRLAARLSRRPSAGSGRER